MELCIIFRLIVLCHSLAFSVSEFSSFDYVRRFCFHLHAVAVQTPNSKRTNARQQHVDGECDNAKSKCDLCARLAATKVNGWNQCEFIGMSRAAKSTSQLTRFTTSNKWCSLIVGPCQADRPFVLYEMVKRLLNRDDVYKLCRWVEVVS